MNRLRLETGGIDIQRAALLHWGTMTQPIEFYFDIASPPSYLAHMRLKRIAEAGDADIVYRPMLLGGIFKISGNAGPIAVPVKRRYMMEVDLPRNAERFSVALNFHPDAPFNSLALMRGALVAEEEGCLVPYADACFQAMWAEAANLAEEATVAEVLQAAGFDAARYIERLRAAEIKQRLIDRTAAAAARGVFGAPTFFLGDEMFFGQDRLDQVIERVAA